MKHKKFAAKIVATISGVLIILVVFQNCTNTFHSQMHPNLQSNGTLTANNLYATAIANGSVLRQGISKGVELITDSKFQSGIDAKYACLQPDTDSACGGISSYLLKNPNGVVTTPAWHLAQWGSLTSLPAEPVKAADYILYGNDKKSLKIFSDGKIEMGLNGFAELGGKYITWSNTRKWPHLLLEQNISAPGAMRVEMESVDKLANLDLSLDFQLLKNDQHKTTGFNADAHTSQFNLYFTLQNLKAGSAGFGQYIWLGVAIFEERSPTPAMHVMKDDGTKMLIYSMPYSAFSDVSAHTGQLVKLRANILPFAFDAISQAVKAGLVTSGNASDYRIGGMNIGYEITGLSETVVQFSNLSLKARVGLAQGATITEEPAAPAGAAPSGSEANNPSPAATSAQSATREPSSEDVAHEGFYRIGGGDGIFYSNGVDAFCVFTNWETYVKWGGTRRADGLGNRASLPTNMTNHGACP